MISKDRGITLAPCNVELWVLPVPSHTATLLAAPQVKNLLTASELERFSRFKVDSKKIEFLVSRILLHHLAAIYTGHKTGELDTLADEKGRPFWFSNGKKIPLFFSLSHTKSMVCCAVSRNEKVGVDVELLRLRKYIAELTKKVFSEEEKEVYVSLPKRKQLPFFYGSWTLKEACVKALGEGLRIPLTSLSFTNSIATDRLSIITGNRLNRKNEEEWSFLIFKPTPEHYLSCTASPPPATVTIKKVKLDHFRIIDISSETFEKN